MLPHEFGKSFPCRSGWITYQFSRPIAVDPLLHGVRNKLLFGDAQKLALFR